MRKKPQKDIWLKIIPGIVMIVAICGVALAVDIYLYSLRSDNLPADAAIVLGAEVRDGKPTPVFEERITHAIYLYKTKQVKMIIFTGGVGENDRLAESVAAKEFAVQAGVPEESILCETKSRTTVENLQGAKEIMASLGLKRVLLVSDPLHMRRSVLMAQDLGIDTYPSPTPTTRYRSFRPKLKFLLHETYLLGVYLFQRLSR